MEVWRRNEVLMHWLAFFTGLFMIWNGFILLFYASVGLSLAKIGIIVAITAVITLIFEIPSGMFADHFGRKNAIIVGNLAALLVPTFLFFGNSFFHFALAAGFMGLVFAFESGSREALVYDGFKQAKKEKKYKKFLGLNQAVAMYVAAVSLIIGGLIATVDFRLLFAIGIFVGLCRVVVSLLFVEVTLSTKKEKLFSRFVEGFKHVFHTRELFYLVMYYVSVAGIVYSLYKFHQLYLEMVGFSIVIIGIVFSGMYLFAGFSGNRIHQIEKLISTKKIFLLMPLVVGILYLIMGFLPSYIAGFLVLIEAVFVGGISFPLLMNFFNEFSPSWQRATVISISNFLMGFVVIVVSLLVGLLSDVIGLPAVYVILGVVLLLSGLFIYNKLLTFKKINDLFIEKEKKIKRKNKKIRSSKLGTYGIL